MIDIDLSEEMNARLIINYRGDIVAEVISHEDDSQWWTKSLDFITDLRGVLHP